MEIRIAHDEMVTILGIDINFSKAEVHSQSQKRNIENRGSSNRERASDEIKIEVQRYILDLQDAYERIQVTRDAASQRRKIFASIKARYDEVWHARRFLIAVYPLTNAEANYIRSVYDYRKAEAATHYPRVKICAGLQRPSSSNRPAASRVTGCAV